METEFRLVYYHRETHKEFRVKTVTRLDFVILDPDTMERSQISRWKLDKDYYPSKENKKASSKNKLYFRRRLTKESA